MDTGGKPHRHFRMHTPIKTRVPITSTLLHWPDEQLPKALADLMKATALKEFLCCAAEKAQRDPLDGSEMEIELIASVKILTRLRNGDNDNGHDGLD